MQEGKPRCPIFWNFKRTWKSRLQKCGIVYFVNIGNYFRKYLLNIRHTQWKYFCGYGPHTNSLELLPINLGSVNKVGQSRGARALHSVKHGVTQCSLDYENSNLWKQMSELLISLGQCREEPEGISSEWHKQKLRVRTSQAIFGDWIIGIRIHKEENLLD